MKPRIKHRIPVTQRALVQRINRKLGSKRRQLRRTPKSQRPWCGEYYIADLDAGEVVSSLATMSALEQLGRKLGVLMTYEAFESLR